MCSRRRSWRGCGVGEISRAELIRYFTLAPADEVFVRKFHSRRNLLGASVQLCTLPWLGFVPDEVAGAPPSVVERLAGRLGIAAGELAGYGRREQTRTGHLREVAAYLGWRPIDEAGWKEPDVARRGSGQCSQGACEIPMTKPSGESTRATV